MNNRRFNVVKLILSFIPVLLAAAGVWLVPYRQQVVIDHSRATIELNRTNLFRGSSWKERGRLDDYGAVYAESGICNILPKDRFGGLNNLSIVNSWHGSAEELSQFAARVEQAMRSGSGRHEFSISALGGFAGHLPLYLMGLGVVLTLICIPTAFKAEV